MKINEYIMISTYESFALNLQTMNNLLLECRGVCIMLISLDIFVNVNKILLLRMKKMLFKTVFC
jgi:hypothetical protein